jgi:hypothetical protein
MNCKELLDLFLAIEDPKQAEDVNYFKCKHLLHYMEDVKKCEFPLDNAAFTNKVSLLLNLANNGATQSLAEAEAEKAQDEAVAYLNSKLGSNGGSRRRASKHSKKSRKSKSRRTKTKSRRH